MHSDSLGAAVQAPRLTRAGNLCRKNRGFSLEGKSIWESAPCLFSMTNVIQLIPLDSTGPAWRKSSGAPLHFCFASFLHFSIISSLQDSSTGQFPSHLLRLWERAKFKALQKNAKGLINITAAAALLYCQHNTRKKPVQIVRDLGTWLCSQSPSKWL